MFLVLSVVTGCDSGDGVGDLSEQRIIFEDRGFINEIYADGTSEKRIGEGPFFLSDDGSKVAFYAMVDSFGGGSTKGIYVQNLDGSGKAGGFHSKDIT